MSFNCTLFMKFSKEKILFKACVQKSNIYHLYFQVFHDSTLDKP